MSRLSNKIQSYQADGKKSLVAYIVAGDPGKDATVKLMHAMVAAGVDIIELGVPFSDPEAEGPVIQLAHERALAHNTSLADIFIMLREFRETDQQTPIILMGYLNPIEVMGYEKFASAASAAGADGTIIVNMPPEEADELSEALQAHDLENVCLLAPTTTDERAAYITGQSHGFVYYVSLKGTTGASILDVDDVNEKLTRFRRSSQLPIMVGFGIKDADTAGQVAAIADGVVVGSAIVSLVANQADNLAAATEAVSQLLSGMRQSIDRVD